MSRPSGASRALTVLLAALFLPLIAVPGAARADDEAEPAFMQHLFAPELILGNARAIGLDKEQRRSIVEEIKQTQARASEAQWSVFEAGETLNELAAADEIDEQAMLAAAREIFEAERLIKEAHLSLMVRMRNALTKEQRAKLIQIREEDD